MTCKYEVIKKTNFLVASIRMFEVRYFKPDTATGKITKHDINQS